MAEVINMEDLDGFKDELNVNRGEEEEETDFGVVDDDWSKEWEENQAKVYTVGDTDLTVDGPSVRGG